MKATSVGLAAVLCLTATTATFGTDAADKPAVAPPPRPLPITATQAEALEQLSATPEYAVAADTRASYSPEASRKMTDLSAAAVQLGIPGTILALLIAAAPL